MKRALLGLKRALLVTLVILTMPRAAEAFCGFYINGAGSQMFNDATQVVLMRMGTRTVLSMQNNYKGPPEAFALVIPVFMVLLLDAQNRLIRAEEAFRGTLTQTSVYPREIVKLALAHNGGGMLGGDAAAMCVTILCR